MAPVGPPQLMARPGGLCPPGPPAMSASGLQLVDEWLVNGFYPWVSTFNGLPIFGGYRKAICRWRIALFLLEAIEGRNLRVETMMNQGGLKPPLDPPS